MDTVSVNFTTSRDMKNKAQKKARKLGFSLDSILDAFLKQFVVKKTITLKRAAEKPSTHLIKAIKQARTERKKGKASPVFDNAEDAIKWIGI